jgi:hypothetical protein
VWEIFIVLVSLTLSLVLPFAITIKPAFAST